MRRPKNADPERSMALLGHLKELRTRLFVVLAVFIVFLFAAYALAPAFVQYALDRAKNYSFIQTGVAELLGQYIKVSVIVAVVMTLPVALWQIDGFVKPGLTKAEHGVMLLAMITAPVLFFSGAAFCFFVVIPFTLQFFLSINTIAVAGLYSVKEYLSYMVAFMLSFGAIFEVPMATALLSAIGLLKPGWMIRAQRVVIVLCFLIGALITPPDVASQVMVAVPMMLLYEASILVCKVVYGRRRKRLIAAGVDVDAQDEESGERHRTRLERARAKVDREDARGK